MTSSLKVAVIGAGGATGQLIVNHALAAGHIVTALVRKPHVIGVRDRLHTVKADMMNVDELASALAGQDAVVFAAGPPHIKQSTVRTDGARNTVAAMKRAGVKRLIAISGLGAGESKDALGFFVSNVIAPLILGRLLMDQNGLEQAIRGSGLDWTIVRPGELIDGPSKGGAKISLDGRDISSKVSRDDVARFIVDELTTNAHVRQAPALGH